MISSAQLSRPGPCLQPHQLSQGGVGEEVWLQSLELNDVTKPPECLGLCLTRTLPREGTDWGEQMGPHGCAVPGGLQSSSLTQEASGVGHAHCHSPGGKTESPLEIDHQALFVFHPYICRTVPLSRPVVPATT